MKPLGPGSRLGRFEISGVLGQGAMGTVYLAHDSQIERPVAVKTLRAEAMSGDHAREIESRFLKEAKLAGRLQHPNIVTIYEVGQDQGLLFIAMEYVEGESLTRFLASHREFSLSERVDVVRQVALALGHAHERGVLHRDIKPGNILMTGNRRVKVADFGIGKLLTATADLTRTGQLIGSPAYMSPEQVRGEKLDGRSDFFSLGVVLYEMLTGSRPFPGESITTLVYQILHTEPRDPLEIRSDLPPSTRDVLARLLAKSPNKRPGDAEEFLRELRRIEFELTQADRTRPLRTSAIAASPPPGTSPTTDALAATFRAAAASPARSSARGGPNYLFGVAALLLAAAALIAIWRSTAKPERSVLGVVTPALPSHGAPTALPQASSQPLATPVPTPAALPTSGPRQAADAIVGAPRYVGSPAPSRPPRTGVAQAGPAAQVPASSAEAPEPATSRASASIDRFYRTRRYARFGVSPDQARMHVDGRYVGTADDWDNHGGGKDLEFRNGSHRVRFDLPGYRELNLEILVTPDADEETVKIDDELERLARVPYPKIPKIDDSTTGAVEFAVAPPDAIVSEGNKRLGSVSSFGSESPLRLAGPMVHDLVLSAPGRKSRTVRILVAGNAERDRARVKGELKSE